MKKILSVFLFTIILSPVLYALPSSDVSQFEKANIAYREGKFDEAAALYRVVAEKYPEDAAFQYNLGNALHRKGEVGTAILAYERARRAAPRNGDILYNLNYMRGLLEYRIEDKRNEFTKLAEKFLGYFTFEELLLVALGGAFLLLSSWVWALFFKQDTSWGIIRKMILIIALLAAGFVAAKTVQMNFFREAIVVAKEAQVYYGPSVNDQAAFRLSDGLKVYVVDGREGWSRILLASGESGWIQQDQIAEVSPQSR